MICRERNLIFIHIPKCGGTSIEDVIWPTSGRSTEQLWMGFVRPMFNKYQTGGLQHLLARQVREEVGVETFDKCFKFTLVRHPLDRIISQYRYMHTREDLRDFVGLANKFSFEQYLTAISSVTHVQWLPQTAFFQDDNYKTIVDRIYRLEDLSREVEQINRDLGLSLAYLPKANAADEAIPKPILSSHSMAQVYDMFRSDYEILGYPRRISN